MIVETRLEEHGGPSAYGFLESSVSDSNPFTHEIYGDYYVRFRSRSGNP